MGISNLPNTKLPVPIRIVNVLIEKPVKESSLQVVENEFSEPIPNHEG